MKNQKMKLLHSAEDMKALQEMLACLAESEHPKASDYPLWYSYSFKSHKELEARLTFIEVEVKQKINQEGFCEAVRLKLHDGFTV